MAPWHAADRAEHRHRHRLLRRHPLAGILTLTILPLVYTLTTGRSKAASPTPQDSKFECARLRALFIAEPAPRVTCL